MTERPPLLPDLFRMIVKMIVGGILVIALVSCGVGVVAGAGASAAGGKGKVSKEATSAHLYGEKDSENAIMRVNIIGPILSHQPQGDDSNFFSSISGVTYGYSVKEDLLKAAKNDKIKGVMLFVTTPGGSIVGSQAIHEGVLAVKAAGKPVVAYIDTMSASGGVWSTAATDKIFSDYGSIIGSVGVNFGNWPYFNGPMNTGSTLFSQGIDTQNGIEFKFIGAGLGKDIGNPFRPMTEREEALLNASAEEYYQAFLDHVTENRPIDRNRLINEYGAMIFADELAKERGYIDDIKNYQETLEYIAGQFGAEGDDWKLVAPPAVEKTPFEELFGVYLRATAGDKIRQQQVTGACAELTSRPVIMPVKAIIDFCDQ